MTSGIHRLEAKVANLKNRWDEDLKDDLKFAILIGMFPTEYEDMILQTGITK